MSNQDLMDAHDNKGGMLKCYGNVTMRMVDLILGFP